MRLPAPYACHRCFGRPVTVDRRRRSRSQDPEAPRPKLPWKADHSMRASPFRSWSLDDAKTRPSGRKAAPAIGPIGTGGPLARNRVVPASADCVILRGLIEHCLLRDNLKGQTHCRVVTHNISAVIGQQFLQGFCRRDTRRYPRNLIEF
jgi:hypothetical protein